MNTKGGGETKSSDFTLLKASWAMRKKVSFSVCTKRPSDEAKLRNGRLSTSLTVREGGMRIVVERKRKPFLCDATFHLHVTVYTKEHRPSPAGLYDLDREVGYL